MGCHGEVSAAERGHSLSAARTGCAVPVSASINAPCDRRVLLGRSSQHRRSIVGSVAWGWVAIGGAAGAWDGRTCRSQRACGHVPRFPALRSPTNPHEPRMGMPHRRTLPSGLLILLLSRCLRSPVAAARCGSLRLLLSACPIPSAGPHRPRYLHTARFAHPADPSSGSAASTRSTITP